MWSLPSSTDIKVIDHDKCAACEHVVRRGVCIKCSDRRYFQAARDLPQFRVVEFFGPIRIDATRLVGVDGNIQRYGRALRRGAKP